MQRNCPKCTSNPLSNQKVNASFFSSLLIVLIPKCPLCIMAYSSAITLCGGKQIYTTHNNLLSYIPLLLSLLIIILLIRNYRDIRSAAALVLAIIGTGLIVSAHQLILESFAYNIGASLLFLAIWLNGSMLSFVSALLLKFKSQKRIWQQ